MGTTGSTVKTVLVAQVQYRTKNTGRTITAETRIIEPFAISLELPPLVRFGVFLFFCLSRGLSSSVFTSAVFFAPSKVGNS